jgi:hypothetical protein
MHIFLMSLLRNIAIQPPWILKIPMNEQILCLNMQREWAAKDTWPRETLPRVPQILILHLSHNYFITGIKGTVTNLTTNDMFYSS